MLLGASNAGAAGVGTVQISGSQDTILQRVHTVDEAEDTLHDLGYYDIRLERSTLPYSFNACKRGARYHIHVDYYGDLVQVDRVGSCGYGSRDRDYRPAYRDPDPDDADSGPAYYERRYDDAPRRYRRTEY